MLIPYKKEDYFLSFWVQGVSVFVTDIHRDVYKELEVLYIIDHGTFKQYFTKKAYERALERGLVFYSDKTAFDDYREALSLHCDKFVDFFSTQIVDKQEIPKETVSVFFEYTKKLCGEYAKMNLEFTDKAFLMQETNDAIKDNLLKVARFKDKIRAVMNTVLFEVNGYTAQLFVILANQFNVSATLLENFTQREILGLFENKIPDAVSVGVRQQSFVESYDCEDIFEGEAAREIIHEFKEEVTEVTTLKGQVASKGKVIGRVKIIPVDYSDLARVNMEIGKMNQGDILVAETTAPELIVACRKAGAILTDMGGLMSHAAIVSREMGIPCIVGLEKATRILKDGDVVEVDAVTGIVKIKN